jgi:Phage tail protein (Tail_P2_I)
MSNLPWAHDFIDLRDEVPLASFAHELYEELAPIAIEDKAHGFALAHFVAAMGVMIQDIADLSRAPSAWGDLVDPDTAPPEALGWLAQFVGIRLPQQITADEARAIIKDETNFRRGTVRGIREAIQRLLTGTKHVGIIERADGDPYKIAVTTWTDETPDPAAVTALLSDDGPNAILPAGIIWTYATTAGTMLFGELKATGKTFGQVKTDYASFGALKNTPSP